MIFCPIFGNEKFQTHKNKIFYKKQHCKKMKTKHTNNNTSHKENNNEIWGKLGMIIGGKTLKIFALRRKLHEYVYNNNSNNNTYTAAK